MLRTAEASDQLWENRPRMIRSFIEMRPHYEKLAEEVAYIFERGVRAAEIQYSSIIWRAKSLDSFCEKVIRKNYKYPLKEITDIAGVRLVFLYLTDRTEIEKMIEREFKVVEKIDKVTKEEEDRFGYGALHYLISLGKKASGARYDNLKDLICEIQVRTILQDAWATVAHHLSYKQESDVPKELRRKLNALSGLFETADDQFDQLRERRKEYKEKVKQQISTKKKDFLQSRINLDNLTEFLNWKLPERAPSNEEIVSELLTELESLGYTKLANLDRTVNLTYDAVKAHEKKYPPIDPDTEQNTVYAQVGVARAALDFVHDDRVKSYTLDWQKRVQEFRHLIKRSS